MCHWCELPGTKLNGSCPFYKWRGYRPHRLRVSRVTSKSEYKGNSEYISCSYLAKVFYPPRNETLITLPCVTVISHLPSHLWVLLRCHPISHFLMHLQLLFAIPKFIYIYTYISVYVDTYTHKHNAHTYTYICIYIYTHIYLYIQIHTYIYTCKYMCKLKSQQLPRNVPNNNLLYLFSYYKNVFQLSFMLKYNFFPPSRGW